MLFTRIILVGTFALLSLGIPMAEARDWQELDVTMEVMPADLEMPDAIINRIELPEAAAERARQRSRVGDEGGLHNQVPRDGMRPGAGGQFTMPSIPERVERPGSMMESDSIRDRMRDRMQDRMPPVSDEMPMGNDRRRP